MKRKTVLPALFLILFLPACAQKLPPSSSEGRGIVVVPTAITNKTQYRFFYHYALVTEPESETELLINPTSSYDFIIMDNLVPGTYQITGIKTISSPGEGLPSIGSRVDQLSRPYPLEIVSGKITVLNFLFVVEQRYTNPNSVEQSSQSVAIRPLEDSQRSNLIEAILALPNADLWDFVGGPMSRHASGIVTKKPVDEKEYKALKDRLQSGINMYTASNFEGAFQSLYPLAKRGETESAFRVAEMYYWGSGVPQNQEKAAQWYLEAAERGHQEAQCIIAVRYRGVVDSDSINSAKFGSRSDPVAEFVWCSLCSANQDVSYSYKQKANWEIKEITLHYLNQSEVEILEKNVAEWRAKPGLFDD